MLSSVILLVSYFKLNYFKQTSKHKLIRLSSLPWQPKRSSQPRFIPKSKSHDDGSDAHVSGGTARGRIARQGARAVQSQSRSPSISPTHHTVHSPTQPQTYLVRSDSMESINTEENAALLKKEENSHSQSSLLIFFDGNEDGDQTCV